MSELRAATISNLAGSGPITLTGQSAAKAWGYVNSAVTPATLPGSENVASLTDNSAGNFTLTFTNAMADTSFGVALGSGGGVVVGCVVPTAKVTGSQNMISVNSSGSAADGGSAHCCIFGDLA